MKFKIPLARKDKSVLRILRTSQRFLETFFFVLGNGFRFGSKTATGCSQRVFEALGILELRVDFTRQSVPSPRPFWR